MLLFVILSPKYPRLMNISLFSLRYYTLAKESIERMYDYCCLMFELVPINSKIMIIVESEVSSVCT
jgi:hypothetical protein